MNNLQKYRVWSQLKQSEICGIAGLSLATYSLVERGKALPKKSTIKKLSKHYKISEMQLYKGRFNLKD